jgi:hypothetical protein
MHALEFVVKRFHSEGHSLRDIPSRRSSLATLPGHLGDNTRCTTVSSPLIQIFRYHVKAVEAAKAAKASLPP